ncbi:MAG: glycosyltransferase [Pseudobutyrivibrio sp.]|nr:glycosyltransferase [Pseudobutyrivibrio sp.]
MNPTFTVIMPTYNSASTIEESLKSIRRQKGYNPSEVEILVVDGGSTDNTIEIAKSYGARIIDNPRRLPEFAKNIGFDAAHGRYGLLLDSDESLKTDNIFSDVQHTFENHSDVKNIMYTGAPAYPGSNAATRYLCRVADPFSNFVYYHFSEYDYIKAYTRLFKYEKIDTGYKFDLREADFYPLSDGSFFDFECARMLKKKHQLEDITTDIFAIMVDYTGYCVFLEDGYIYHDQRVTGKKILSKMRWRIKNNLFSDECVGYATREQKQSGISKRKYLFILYCITIVPVIIKAIYLAITERDVCMLMDIFYTEATFVMICWYMLMKLLHIPVRMDTSYGK